MSRQPHTRQRIHLTGQSTDVDDPRAKSFIHLTNLLPTLTDPPRTIVLENVIGFETSQCCITWIRILNELNYQVDQFHLNPVQFGMPNERPRYYMVARRCRGPASVAGVAADLDGAETRKAYDVRRVSDHLELPHAIDNTSRRDSWLDPWEVDSVTLDKDASWCFDIVRTVDSRTSCFTSSYGRFIRGTGSVLYVPSVTSVESCSAGAGGPDALLQPKDRTFGEDWKGRLTTSGTLRYFTPREVANLLGFPASFDFPPNIRTKKAYGMMGNSLHVGVAAKVIEFALR